MAKLTKVILAIVVAVLISGCATTEVIKWKTKTVEVQVPVYKCPAVDNIQRPELEINKIDTSNNDALFKAYPITIIQLKDYALKLEDAIKEMSNYK